ncbi:glycolate oxidase subunit GlcF [Roseospira visakhapatnamensis]|uniref:Glycolate oxidase iron-sulfur subunit n=1 Tax=Roseospira visakhapatnamensis TaxID=390880 RepID=A0A7W6WAT4_9PROT|nr:glycolate oxidase subunit GlcF [Roseospira visakhapatnamensis]MBB4267530.1 glycolate oxidase iron-sulfur subunit [Roseospira visakhapatnamensis]
MQTRFAEDRLARDPLLRQANDILRTCVHCGFCTATCPTFVLLGDELDSPRGRIYLLKDMLERDTPASASVVKHIDRCLTCLSCVTTCPSGVDYMHLLDQGRAHIERTYNRPRGERLVRGILAAVVPHTGRFRLAMLAGWLTAPVARWMPGRLGALAGMATRRPALRAPTDRARVIPAQGPARMRVALMRNCVQPALDPEIDAAAIRLLTRHGCEVVLADGQGCCGAVVQHMGREEAARAFARANVRAWTQAGVDRVVITVSGCGTTVKDYGHMLAGEPDIAAEAQAISAKTVDVTELLSELGLREPVADPGLTVAYHAACSLQHGQQVKTAPKALLEAAGFRVVSPRDPHLCCGSAGTYSITQPGLSRQLRARKLETLGALEADVVAAGNIGCLNHLREGKGAPRGRPMVHTVQLLDWATGGPRPRGLESQ